MGRERPPRFAGGGLPVGGVDCYDQPSGINCSIWPTNGACILCTTFGYSVNPRPACSHRLYHAQPSFLASDSHPTPFHMSVTLLLPRRSMAVFTGTPPRSNNSCLELVSVVFIALLSHFFGPAPMNCNALLTFVNQYAIMRECQQTRKEVNHGFDRDGKATEGAGDTSQRPKDSDSKCPRCPDSQGRRTAY